MQRKLVKQGNSTLMISLPKQWTTRHNLSKGDDVFLNEHNSNIIISSKRKLGKNSVRVKLSTTIESSIRTIITNTYRRGFSKIIVSFETKEQYSILLDILKTRLVGFEVVRMKDGECVIENITEPSADQFENMVQKIFLNIETLLSLTKNRLCNTSVAEDYEEVVQRIQKYDNFCRRVITIRKLETTHTELLWSFLSLLIHGCRELYYLNVYLDGAKKINAKSADLLDQVFIIFTLIKKSYVKKDVAVLDEIHTMIKSIVYDKGYSLLQKEKESVSAYHLIAAARLFYQANSPLFGMLI